MICRCNHMLSIHDEENGQCGYEGGCACHEPKRLYPYPLPGETKKDFLKYPCDPYGEHADLMWVEEQFPENSKINEESTKMLEEAKSKLLFGIEL